MKWRVWAMLVVLGVVTLKTSPAQAVAPTLEQVGSYVIGTPHYIQSQGNYIYGRLTDYIYPLYLNALPLPFVIIDTSDPVHPAPVGTWLPPYPEIVATFSVSENYAYVLVYRDFDAYDFATASSLYILDISDPAAPQEVDRIDYTAVGEKTYVETDRLYVTDKNSAMNIYSLADPAHPALLTSFSLLTTGQKEARLLTVTEAVIYLAYRTTDNATGLRTVDVSNPLTPVTLATVPEGGSQTTLSTLIINGRYGYLSRNIYIYIDSYLPCRLGEEITYGYLDVIDFADPANLQVVGSIYFPYGWNYGHVVQDTTLYIYQTYPDDSIWTVDVSLPSAPTIGHEINAGNWFVLSPEAAVGFVLDRGEGKGLYSYDLTTPTPTLLGAYHTGKAADVTVSGYHTYVASDTAGVQDVISFDPAHLTPQAWFDVAEDDYVSVRMVEAYDGFLFFNDWNGILGLRVYDITAPTPSAVATWPGVVGGLAHDAMYTYAFGSGDRGYGCYVLSRSLEGTLTTVGFLEATAFDFPGASIDMVAAADGFVYGVYHYYEENPKAFVCVDVTDLNHLHVESITTLDYHPYRIAVRGLNIYVASERGLEVFDVTDRAAPALVATLALGDCVDLVLQNTYAFVLKSPYDPAGLAEAALILVDISDPLHPQEVTRTSWWGKPVALAVDSITAYVCDYDLGLRVFRLPMFFDINETTWAYDAIHACLDAGLIKGYPDGTYRPEGSVTRAQMTGYIARAECGGEAAVPPGPATPSFADVSPDTWGYAYIEYCKAHHIVQGYWNGYHPDAPVTREQMAAYIARAIAPESERPDLTDYTPPTTPSFADVAVDSWAFPYVEYCKAHNVVQGYWDGYHPTQGVTRDQMAVYIARAFGLIP